MLEVQNLTKRFGEKTAVNNVSFQVHPGDAFGLLGPNGAGKSTTISMIAALLSPDSGEVLLDGHSIKRDERYVKERIGLVPQTIALYDHMTAEENLQFWGTVYGLTGSKLKDNIDWCLQVAGLAEHRKQIVKKYSGGMQRRLNIAVGMVHRPQVLIMDEPTVGIDPQSRNHILETVKQLNSDGTTVIYTSHYMEEVQFLCKRLAIMDQGKMIAYGNLDDVKQVAGTLATIGMAVSGDATSAAEMLRQDMSLQQVTVVDGKIVFQAAEAANAVAKAVMALSKLDVQPAGISIEEPNLEAAFLHLTGRQLRDEEEG